ALPPTMTRALAALGPITAIRSSDVLASGSAQIAAHYTVSPLEGIRAALSNAKSVSHAVGCRHKRLIEVAKGKITVEYFKGRG
ncbi:hypothetical protein ACC772_39320, partial [Rhizobium ruizarguesonis]